MPWHSTISDIKAYHADGKDSQQLSDIVLRVQRRLWQSGLTMDTCIADAGYSSGENYAFLEQQAIESYIPPHGTYKGGPDGFIYNEKEDCYICPQGKVIPFTKVFHEKKNNSKKKEYRALKKVCIDCAIRSMCLGKSAQEKKFTITYYRPEYERNIARVNSRKGSYMKGKRQSTVEPVFGTLTQFLGMRKVNTLGLKQANKCMHLSAIAYNLKKYLKFIKNNPQSIAGAIGVLKSSINRQIISGIIGFKQPVILGKT